MKRSGFPVLAPNLQVSFYYRLQDVRRLHLNDALQAAVGKLNVQDIDGELNGLVCPTALRRIASFGLRGELVFPVPEVLNTDPFLLGYYRLLLGISQKEFFNKGPFGRFKVFEAAGAIPERVRPLIPALCESLIGSAEKLVAGLDRLSQETIHELQLLTIGPQFRGSENTRIGQEATGDVRALIESIVHPYIFDQTSKAIIIRNDSDRNVFIEFSADPDVSITEKLESSVRPTLSIEIKGGADASNIHNRLGEAEKSHQKAWNRGFREFWTIVRVDIDEQRFRSESPSTSHFFHLDVIANPRTQMHRKFKDLLASMIGIQSA